jgi:hypothetical protein
LKASFLEMVSDGKRMMVAQRTKNDVHQEVRTGADIAALFGQQVPPGDDVAFDANGRFVAEAQLSWDMPAKPRLAFTERDKKVLWFWSRLLIAVTLISVGLWMVGSAYGPLFLVEGQTVYLRSHIEQGAPVIVAVSQDDLMHVTTTYAFDLSAITRLAMEQRFWLVGDGAPAVFLQTTGTMTLVRTGRIGDPKLSRTGWVFSKCVSRK